MAEAEDKVVASAAAKVAEAVLAVIAVGLARLEIVFARPVGTKCPNNRACPVIRSNVPNAEP